jgi:hypothetical protein
VCECANKCECQGACDLVGDCMCEFMSQCVSER